MKFTVIAFMLFVLIGCDESTDSGKEIPQITHECSLSDTLHCIDNSVESCITSSSGKRIKKITPCGDNNTCWQGTCLEISCNDQPSCINGAKECLEIAGVSKRRICGNFDNDSCFEWQIEEPENNCTCSDGEWVCGCTAGTIRPCDKKDTGGCDQIQICQDDGKTWGDCKRDPDAIVITYYKDGDTDTYGDPNETTETCLEIAPAGYTTNNEDCDDTKIAINPDATEKCDGVDNNCDGNKDEGFDPTTYYADRDEDTFGDPFNTTATCDSLIPDGYVSNKTDCNDNIKEINPDAPEICDRIDNNCNNDIDEGVTTTFYADSDTDTFGDLENTIEACSVPVGYVENNTDCDDADIKINPDAKDICDGIDNNCNEETDEASEFLCEFPAGVEVKRVSTKVCENAGELSATCKITECSFGFYDPDGDFYTGCEYRCEPTNNGIEICDGLDNNCNGNNDDNSGIDEDPDNTLCSANHIITGICKGEAGCGYDTCQDGFFDDDELFYNGCENGCAPVARSASIDTDHFDATMDDQNLYLFYQNNSNNLLIREFDYISAEFNNNPYQPLDDTTTVDINVDQFSVGYHANNKRFFTVYTKDNVLYARTLSHNSTQLIVEKTAALEIDGTEASYYNPYIAKESYDNNRIPFVVLQKSGDYYNLKISTLKTDKIQQVGIAITNSKANVSNFVSQTPYQPLVTTLKDPDSNSSHFPIIYCKKDGTDTPENFNLYLQMMDDGLNKIGEPTTLNSYEQKEDGFCTELMENVTLTSNNTYFYIGYPVAQKKANESQTIKIEARNYDGSSLSSVSSKEIIIKGQSGDILYPRFTAQENTLLVIYQEETTNSSIQHYVRLALDNGAIIGKIAGGVDDTTILNQNNTTTSFKSLPFYTDQKRVMILTQEENTSSDGIPSVYLNHTEFCEDLSSDLMTYFPLDGDVTDLYGNLTPADQTQEELEYPGEVVNITFEPGSMGQRAIFNGTDAYIQLPKIDENFNRGITYSLWVYIDTLTLKSWIRFFDFGNGENDGLIFGRYNLTKRASFQHSKEANNNDNYKPESSSYYLETKNWIHLTVTATPDGTITFYKNGNLFNTEISEPLRVTSPRTTNYIGKSNWSDPLFEGKMDEIFIYSRALRDHEVKALYDFAPVSK